MNKCKTILIISTDATRTGTPILLLDLVKWLSNNSEYQFIFILQEGGTLFSDYEKLGKVYLWYNILNFGFQNSAFFLLVIKILKKIKLLNNELLANSFIKKIKNKNNIVLTYSNTARNGYLLECFSKSLKTKILTHVHEGEKTLQLWNKNGYVKFNLDISHSFITVSKSVKNVLINQYKIEKDISVIPGAINTKLKFNSEINLKRQLGIEDDKKILICCGWLGWHKGTDFFIQLAKMISIVRNDIVLIWLGGSNEDESYLQMVYDIQKMNLTQYVKLISSKPNPIDYIQISNILLMLSRDESFSLVTAEAGWLKKPVLCWEDSGGPCEIVKDDKRFILPYGDLEALFQRVVKLIDNQIEMEQMGIYLKNRITQFYTIDKTAPQILKRIEELIN